MLFTILVDSREQKPFTFESYAIVETQEATLNTGDYTLAELCDEEDGTYYPNLAVERKAGQDFLQSVTTNRDRFSDEIDRAEDWAEPMPVYIEEPWNTYKYSTGFMQYRDVHPNAIQGTVEAWTEYKNVEFHFFSGRERAQQETFDILMQWFRDYA